MISKLSLCFSVLLQVIDARKMTARFTGNLRMNKLCKDKYTEFDGNYVLADKFISETGGTLSYPFGFVPTLHKYRMDYPQKIKIGSNIFVCSMADLFGEWVQDGWIDEVFKACAKNPLHNYLFLTKNPKRYKELDEKQLLPRHDNMWYGSSITCADDLEKNDFDLYGVHRFFSIEPLLDDVSEKHNLFMQVMKCVEWVIIGAESGNRKGKVTPKIEWIQNNIEVCGQYGIPVFMKDSLIPIVEEVRMRRVFPNELQQHKRSELLANKLETECGRCGIHKDKKQMIAVFARSERGEQPKQVSYLCRDCFKKTCQEWNAHPQLKNFEM